MPSPTCFHSQFPRSMLEAQECRSLLGGVPSSGWPGTGQHGKIKLLAASWLSPACPPSHCPHANREAWQPASAFGFWRPHLQPSWPSSLPLTASPECHQLGHFPTDTGASKWPRRMCLFADSWQSTGFPSIATCWCGCPLLTLPKPSCQGGAAWSRWRWGGRHPKPS